MAASDPAAALAELLGQAEHRIRRAWTSAVARELREGLEIGRKELSRPFDGYLAQLAQLLAIRKNEAPALWAEVVRHHGGLRLEQHFRISDVEREFHVLGIVLVREWILRHGPVPEGVALLVGDIVAQGCCMASEDYVRRLRADRAHLSRAAPIEAIVRHMAEGLIAVESDGTISFVTPAAAKILGVPENELEGLRLGDAEALIRRLDLRDEAGERLEVRDLPYLEALTPGRETRTRFLRLRRPSAPEESVVETRAIPVFDRGELRGAVETLSDRTEEYRQRQLLARAYEELRALHLQLLGRSRTLALGELFASVSGALNNAMNAIRLHSELLRSEGVGREHLDGIQRSVDDVAKWVTRLQELVAPRAPMEGQPVPLDEVVREAMELIRPDLASSLTRREVHLEVDLAARRDIKALRADVRELVVHLLLGALEGAKGTVRIATHVEGGVAVLDLSDPTPQVPTERLATLGELVRPWGGAIVAEPQANGTRIRVTLPLWDGLVARVAPEVTARLPLAARRVLLVDDDDENRETLAQVLMTQGLEVTPARTAAEAEAIAKAQPFDVALVDLAMPDRSGWELVPSLRDLRPDLRIALVSGYEAMLGEHPDVHVDAMFRKPVDVGQLLSFLGRR